MKKFIVSFAFIISIAPMTQAEWATESESPVVLTNQEAEFTIQADGTSEEVIEQSFKIQNETGRNLMALTKVYYSPSSTKAEVLSASTTTDGVVTPVDLKTLQERTANIGTQGISDLKEIVIPMVNLKIGSLIKYKFRLKKSKVLIPGLYSTILAYGIEYPEQKGFTTIRSKNDIIHVTYDPEHFLEVKETIEDGWTVVRIKLLRPIMRISKDTMPILPALSMPQVQMTTMRTWNQFAKPLAEKYEAILAGKLPPLFAEINKKAALKKDPYEKMDVVTSELANVMTYSGNWIDLEKQFYPKTLKEIATLKIGDCKDFATATAAMLRGLGMKADLALVYRKSPKDIYQNFRSYALNMTLAIPSLFNHAIVKVYLNDKVIWLDPTNMVSNSRLINYDISVTAALAINKDTTAFDMIGTSSADDNQFMEEREIKINDDDTVDSTAHISMTGNYSKEIREASFSESAEKMQKVIAYLGGMDASSNLRFDNLQLQSRIAGKLQVDIHTAGEKIFKEKENKKYLIVPLPFLSASYLSVKDDRVSHLYIGEKAFEKHITKVDGYDFTDKMVGCVALTYWYDLKRQFIKTEKGFEIHDTFENKRLYILSDEARGVHFQYRQSSLMDCHSFANVEIVKLAPQQSLKDRLAGYTLEKIKEHVDVRGAASIENSQIAVHKAEQLLVNGNDKDVRLQLVRAYRRVGYIRNDVEDKYFLMKSDEILEALYKDFPKDAEVLRQKVFSYINQKNAEQMKEFFSKAYYASKKDFDIYYLGGAVGRALKNDSLAEGSYLKALQFAKRPIDFSMAYQDLSYIYGNRKDDLKQLEYLKKAAEYDPKNAWVKGSVLNKLIDLKRWDEAIITGEEMLKVSDFGVGRRQLGNAYAGKAQSLPLTAPNYEKIEEACMKSLKFNTEKNECLLLLGKLNLQIAQSNQDKERLQRSISYFERAKKEFPGDPAPQSMLEISQQLVLPNIAPRIPASN